MSYSNENNQPIISYAGERRPKRNLAVSVSRFIPQTALQHAAPLKRLRAGRTGQALLFIVEVAVLEVVRRISRARCPFVWNFLQALQVLGYPPFKWVQGWGLLGAIVRAIKKLSRPMLFLSITTAVSEVFQIWKRTNTHASDSPPEYLSSSESSIPNRICGKSDNTSNDTVSENWLSKVHQKLEKEGITLPERIDADELQRFYSATKGDLECLMSSLKKTIRWRETYYLLSSHELEKWSTLVFWHGFDVMNRPCLFLRLGVACNSLCPPDRPRFCQALVSQMEHGVLHMVNRADPRISVLIDCEGLSPIRFPMQMMKTCCTLVQDHYPNRLANLLVIRVPAISRVITQTFMKILRPDTRQRLRIEGQEYHALLSEVLQNVPQFLGGDCNCSKCKGLLRGKPWVPAEDESGEESDDTASNLEPLVDQYPTVEASFFGNGCEHVIRTAVLGILMLWIVIAFLAGMHE